MTIEQGRILTVDEEDAAARLTADVAIGATVLPVSAAYPFNEGGGQLDLNGAILTYTKADPDADTVTLPTGLTVAALADDPVLVYPYGTVKIAMVDLYDSDDSQRAIVPFGYTASLDVGIRDEVDQEQCTISDEKGYWEVVGLDEEIPMMDGTYIDPTTLPSPTTPTTPPASSPTLTAYGTVDNVILRATDVEASSQVEYHASTTSGFTPGPTTLLPGTPTKSLVYIVNMLPDGTIIQQSTTYYFKAVAINAIGAAAPSPEVSGTTDSTKASSVFAAEVVAGFILTGRIQIGVAYFDANEGLVIPQPDGGTITMPVNGIDPAIITANFIAKMLTVEGGLTIKGTGQLFGQLSLTAGITNPTAFPTISTTYGSSVAGGLNDGYVHRGLAEHSSTQWATTILLFGTAIRILDKSTLAAVGTDNSGTWSSNYIAWGGITKLGSFYYLFGQDYNRSGKYYIYKIDPATWTKSAEFYVADDGFFPGIPHIGNDGTNVLLANVGAGHNLNLRTYNAALTAQIGSSVVLMAGLTGTPDLGGFANGTCGAPTNSLWISTMSTSDRTWSFSVASLGHGSTLDFPKANGANVQGMAYDSANGYMVHFDDSAHMYKYGTYNSDRVVRGAYSWYDGDATGGTHETMIGPTNTRTVAARGWPQIETPPATEINNTDASDHDRANQIRIYASEPSTNPVMLQATLAIGTTKWSTQFALATATSPPASNGFVTVLKAPGSILSTTTRANEAKPKTEINGDGSGRFDAIMPCGAILMYTNVNAPTGWLVCDGSSFSSTTYPELAAVLGDTYGTHSGTTYFLPDLRRRAPMGHSTAPGSDGVQLLIGHNEASAVADRTTQHDHGAGSLATDAHTQVGNTTATGGSNRLSAPVNHTMSGRTQLFGGYGSFPHLTVQYIIKT